MNEFRLDHAVGIGGSMAGTLAAQALSERFDRVLGAVADDPEVNAAYLRVLNMLDEPTALFAPRLAVRVLRRRRFEGAEQPDPVRILSDAGSTARKELT